MKKNRFQEFSNTAPFSNQTRNLSKFFFLGLGILFFSTAAWGQIITTVAGTGVVGSLGDGGPATAAQLHTPFRVAVNGSGDLFISEFYRIRRVDHTTGIISTYVGTGTDGFSGDGGLATEAMISTVGGLAFDASGNLYFSDAYNNRIRRVDAMTGIVTTIAGTGAYSFSGDGGPALAACFKDPLGLAFDHSGNLLIAELESFRIRKINMTTGIITTVAGSGPSLTVTGDGGPATAAHLAAPFDVVADESNNFYFASQVGNDVRKVDALTGIITTLAGDGISGYSGDGGPSTAARLNGPKGLGIDGLGNIYVMDRSNYRVRRIDKATGVINTVVGNGVQGYAGDGGPATEAEIALADDAVLDASGNLYIADTTNFRVRKITGPLLVPTPDVTSSHTPTATPTPTSTGPTGTPTPTYTITKTFTGSATPTHTRTSIGTPTYTKTYTRTYTFTPTRTYTSSIFTYTPTVTGGTRTPIPIFTSTNTPYVNLTATIPVPNGTATSTPLPPTGCDLTGWTLQGDAGLEFSNQIRFFRVENTGGSAWAPTLLNLNSDFDLTFRVFLGSSVTGSDGIAFMIQSQGPNALGGAGGGLGYGDLNGYPPLNHAAAIHPSVAVEIDTFRNIEFPDPTYDHIVVVENGIQETPASGVLPAMPGNATIKDGNEHDFKITWNAATRVMQVYLDGRFILTYTKDMVAQIFGGNPNVYWGMTGSTNYTVQYFRLAGCAQGVTVTPTVTHTSTGSTRTATPTRTPTMTNTLTHTKTYSSTPTVTHTSTGSTRTPFPTFTNTPLGTPTNTFTPTAIVTQVGPVVTHYGCFAQTGDGWDFIQNGQTVQVASIVPAGTVPWSAPCGLQWISNNPGGLAPNPPPSNIFFNRSFTLDPSLIAHGVFTLRFKADDAVEFRLNGQSVAIASCNPPPGNDGECQQYCHEVAIPASALLGYPQVNTLQVKLTNLFNVAVGNGNTGWTGLSYALCVDPLPIVATGTPTPTPTKTSTPIPVKTVTPTATPKEGTLPVPCPNPSHGEPIHFKGCYHGNDQVRMTVYTVGYRRICQSTHRCQGESEMDMVWDLTDQQGARVSNGVYYVLFEKVGGSHKSLCKVMILR
jgi:sugar lactone lactonase YvrE